MRGHGIHEREGRVREQAGEHEGGARVETAADDRDLADCGDVGGRQEQPPASRMRLEQIAAHGADVERAPLERVDDCCGDRVCERQRGRSADRQTGGEFGPSVRAVAQGGRVERAIG